MDAYRFAIYDAFIKEAAKRGRKKGSKDKKKRKKREDKEKNKVLRSAVIGGVGGGLRGQEIARSLKEMKVPNVRMGNRILRNIASGAGVGAATGKFLWD